MKKYLFTGFITLLPIALTFMIIGWLFDFFTTPFVGIVERLMFAYEKTLGMSLEHHDMFVLFISRVIVLIFLFFLIFFLGFFGQKYFFDAFMRLINKLLLRIPFVKGIYRLTKDVTAAVFSEKGKTFKETVLVPYPTEDLHSLGFVTGGVPPVLKKAVKDVDYTVFVPTAPHPISGFLLLVPKSKALSVDVTTEEAFKFLLSCGVIHPGQRPPKKARKRQKK